MQDHGVHDLGPYRGNLFSEPFRYSYFSSLRLSTFASFVGCPVFFNDFDIVGLTLLGAATEQDDEGFAVLAEVNPIAWAPINFEFRNAVPRRFDVRKVTYATFSKAVVTFAAAGAFSPANHVPKGLLPSTSMYSRTSITNEMITYTLSFQ